MKRALIIGGYGNFGGRIAHALAQNNLLEIVVAGRNAAKAAAFCAAAQQPNLTPLALDAARDLPAALQQLRPAVLVNASGPFQNQDYAIARHCIDQGVPYIDLADAADFVCGFAPALNERAERQNIAAIAGASTVPALSSAVLDHFLPQFSILTDFSYGIVPGFRSMPGPAVTAAVLSYAGHPFTALQNGAPHTVYGWQDTQAMNFPGLGTRYAGNCAIPDLQLFPARYPDLRTLRFRAGIELAPLHFGLWLLSWLVRGRLLADLRPYAGLLHRAAQSLRFFGSDRGGMACRLTGLDRAGQPQTINWFIIAERGDGPHIPCVPAILLARRILSNTGPRPGAYPCLSLITLPDYLSALSKFAVTAKTA